MNNLLRSRSIDTDVLLRALAISSVTLNHALPHAGGRSGVAGGMTALLMLSGYSFARFIMAGASARDMQRGLASFTLRIFVPSFIAVLFFFAVQREISLTELLFIRNWFDPDRIAIFPVWYPQVIVQMGLGLMALFAIPGLAAAFLRNPLAASAILWAGAVAVRMILPLYIDTKPLLHHLPHLYLWNFVLGWLVFFLLSKDRVDCKLAATAVVLLSAYLVWTPRSLQFWALGVAGIALVWAVRVRLPAPVTHVAGLVSQATFTIFLLHRFVYAVYDKVLAPPLPKGVTMWIVGMICCLIAWVLAAAASRAYRKLDRQRLTGAAPLPSGIAIAKPALA